MVAERTNKLLQVECEQKHEKIRLAQGDGIEIDSAAPSRHVHTHLVLPACSASVLSKIAFDLVLPML